MPPDPLDFATCEEVFRSLDDFLDRELSPSDMDRLARHLESCAACAAEFRFEKSLIAEVRGRLRRLPVPGDLLARISAGLDGHAITRRGPSGRRG